LKTESNFVNHRATIGSLTKSRSDKIQIWLVRASIRVLVQFSSPSRRG